MIQRKKDNNKPIITTTTPTITLVEIRYQKRSIIQNKLKLFKIIIYSAIV